MNLLELRDVGKHFPSEGKKWVFRHLNFAFPCRGLFLICGPSGCGKSTLLSLLSGLSRPSEGNVYFQNRLINRMDERAMSSYRSKEIGLVFQHYNLLEGLTSKENVLLPYLISSSRKEKKKAENLLENVGLKEKVDQCVDTLSGGEKQRVAICRALINSPKILFCDEPTGALDKKNSIAIMELLNDVARQTLVILVSHDLELTRPYATGVLDLGDVKGE